MRELSTRHWCPNCHIERTGDDLTMPCACMVIPHRLERQKILHAERETARVFYEREAIIIGDAFDQMAGFFR